MVLEGSVEPGAVRGGFVFLALVSSLALGFGLGNAAPDLDAWRLALCLAGFACLFLAMRVLRALKGLEAKCGGCMHPLHERSCPSVYCSCPERGVTA